MPTASASSAVPEKRGGELVDEAERERGVVREDRGVQRAVRETAEDGARRRAGGG